MPFTCYTREAAHQLNPLYFKPLGQCEPGTQRRLVGRVIPDHAAQKSAMIVKRSTREPTGCLKSQGRHGKRSYYNYYSIVASDYCTAWISWATGDVIEVRAYASQAEATKAQHRMAHHFAE